MEDDLPCLPALTGSWMVTFVERKNKLCAKIPDNVLRDHSAGYTVRSLVRLPLNARQSAESPFFLAALNNSCQVPSFAIFHNYIDETAAAINESLVISNNVRVPQFPVEPQKNRPVNHEPRRAES